MSPTTEAMVTRVVTALLTGGTIREIASDMEVSHQNLYQLLKKWVDPDALLRIYEKSKLVRQQARGAKNCVHCGKFIKVVGMKYCSAVCRVDGKAAILAERAEVCRTILNLRKHGLGPPAIGKQLKMSKFMVNHYVAKYRHLVVEVASTLSCHRV